MGSHIPVWNLILPFGAWVAVHGYPDQGGVFHFQSVLSAASFTTGAVFLLDSNRKDAQGEGESRYPGM